MILCRFYYILTFIQLRAISSAKYFPTFPLSVPLKSHQYYVPVVLAAVWTHNIFALYYFPCWPECKLLEEKGCQSVYVPIFFCFKTTTFLLLNENLAYTPHEKHLNSACLLGEFQNISPWCKTADVIGGFMNANWCLKE